MVTERFEPAIGGVEKHVGGLARALAGRGYRVTVVAPAHQSDLRSEELIDGVSVHRIPVSRQSPRRYLFAWSWWLNNRDLVRSADILHFHEVYALLHWSGPLLLLWGKKPRFVTFHGYEMAVPVPKRARLYRAVASRITHGNICVGHYLTKWFDIQPDAVIYGAVSLPSEPVPSTSLKALYLGRLARDTGIDIYIEGLGILRRQHGIDLPLVVCGDGPERDTAQTLALRQGIQASFLGFQPAPERFLADCSVVFTSGYLAILEAMAYKRPVFSVYHNPVKADYLQLMPGAHRILTVAESPQRLASLLKEYYERSLELDEKVEWAYQFACDQSWSRLVETYEAVWSRDKRSNGETVL
jgi:glycosyltransferase involved in cell wall biosynthesis